MTFSNILEFTLLVRVKQFLEDTVAQFYSRLFFQIWSTWLAYRAVGISLLTGKQGLNKIFSLTKHQRVVARSHRLIDILLLNNIRNLVSSEIFYYILTLSDGGL